ncbi:MAG: reverse transcriptase domain-containing protein, partial [Pseudomonadota bacterium]
HYRKILLEKYEARLASLGISECPIAYRQVVKDPNSQSGKCNIDFAKDAFDEVKMLGNCVAVALDIKGYFDTLDHGMIKELWLELLDLDRLPKDHFSVFKNITEYKFVDQKDVYRRLGYLEKQKDGKYEVERFTIPYSEMPKQLCSSRDFREKICGGDPSLASLVQRNSNKFGIPQGAPISDLIANFYLMHFDKAVFEYVKARGGRYMRYSDDILLILPGGISEAQSARKFVSDEVKNYGEQLEIKDTKTCIVQFMRSSGELEFKHIEGPQGKNGLEYLGFCFDGKNVRIRNSTISRFYRKVAIAARKEAFRHKKNSGLTDVQDLLDSFNFSLLSQRFTRVKRTAFLIDDVRTWTFWTYLRRAAKAFGDDGQEILKQASGYRSFVRQRVERAIIDALG